MEGPILCAGGCLVGKLRRRFLSETRVLSTRRMSVVQGLLGGLAAGCAFLLLELAARVLAGIPTLPELVQDRAVQATPGPLFAFFLHRLLYLGKPAFFASLLLFHLLLASFGGVVVARLRRPFEVAFALWLFTGLVVLPLARQGIFADRPSVATAQFIAFGAYAVALSLLWPPAAQPRTEANVRGTGITRRGVLAAGVMLLASAALARRAVGTISHLLPRGLPAPITSADDFYAVSKNLSDPEVDAASWRLYVDGMVDHPLNLSLGDIMALPAQQVIRTLECISNMVGGRLISNGAWTGVRLSDVLVRAGVRPDATTLHFTSVDDYTESMALQKAMDENTLLVYQLNGQPLGYKHGYPLRVLGAGTYGMKNPKWLKRIEVAASSPDGFWEEQGWSSEAIVRTMSRVDVPTTLTVPVGFVDFAGIAFAGDRGIQKIELSKDYGTSWDEVVLSPPLGPLTWVFWKATLALETGRVEVMVRATDGTGQIQTGRDMDAWPDGATGYHRRQVRVEG